MPFSLDSPQGRSPELPESPSFSTINPFIYRQVFRYNHRCAIVLIPAASQEEADRTYQRQYGAGNPVPSNVFEV